MNTLWFALTIAGLMANMFARRAAARDTPHAVLLAEALQGLTHAGVERQGDAP
jgi:hypothetical protein